MKLTTTPENVIELRVAPSVPPARAPVGLSNFDVAGIRVLAAAEHSPAAVAHAEGYAQALAGPDGGGARLRLLSRAVGSTEVMRELLEGLLAAHLKCGNEKQAALVERALRGASERLVRLMEAHRAESHGQQRAVIAVAHADQVTVGVD